MLNTENSTAENKVAPASQQVKQDCYSCKHRNNIPGDCHSSCSALEGDPFVIANYVHHNGPSFPSLKLNPHGVINGWCFWPVNFDPCWVEDCKFYEQV